MRKNKILLLCEGKNEEKLLEILLDEDALIFKKEDLIELRAFPIPYNIKSPFIISSIIHNGEEIDIIRVKDSQKDKITIPKELKRYVSKDRIFDYCTKPEIEMLLIYNENLINEYLKVKSKISPKDFAKSNIIYKGHKYDNSTKFYEEYYGGEDNKGKLVNNIKGLKKYQTNKKREKYLADLLK